MLTGNTVKRDRISLTGENRNQIKRERSDGRVQRAWRRVTSRTVTNVSLSLSKDVVKEGKEILQEVGVLWRVHDLNIVPDLGG